VVQSFAGLLQAEALRDLLEAERAAANAELVCSRRILAIIDADPGTSDQRTLVGPRIILANGVASAVAQRDWLR
jgi:hypothetical protein